MLKDFKGMWRGVCDIDSFRILQNHFGDCLESKCGGVMKKMERHRKRLQRWSRRMMVGWTGVAVRSMDICPCAAEK